MLVTSIPACLMASTSHTHKCNTLDLLNTSNHTELLTFSQCVRSTVRSESWQPLDCSLTHTVVVSTATFFYTSLVPRPLVCRNYSSLRESPACINSKKETYICPLYKDIFHRCSEWLPRLQTNWRDSGYDRLLWY